MNTYKLFTTQLKLSHGSNHSWDRWLWNRWTREDNSSLSPIITFRSVKGELDLGNWNSVKKTINYVYNKSSCYFFFFVEISHWLIKFSASNKTSVYCSWFDAENIKKQLEIKSKNRRILNNFNLLDSFLISVFEMKV